jgi:hypothetical protein
MQYFEGARPTHRGAQQFDTSLLGDIAAARKTISVKPRPPTIAHTPSEERKPARPQEKAPKPGTKPRSSAEKQPAPSALPRDKG